jgi:5-methylcytosine-specific restriction endonuclease McrA
MNRKKVYEKYHGKCAYCGNELNGKFHVDHIIPIKRISVYNSKKRKYVQTKDSKYPELDVLENCNPSCASCNINKSDRSIEQFRDFIQNFIISLNRDSTQYKLAKRYNLIQETNNQVKFYFENEY